MRVKGHMQNANGSGICSTEGSRGPQPQNFFLKNSRYFCWIVYEDWDDRGVLVAIDDETHLIQPFPKVPAIVQQLLDPFLPCANNTHSKLKMKFPFGFVGEKHSFY